MVMNATAARALILSLTGGVRMLYCAFWGAGPARASVFRREAILLMSDTNKERARVSDDASATQAGSVYYRQMARPRRRVPPPRMSPPGKSASKKGNVGHAILVSNIRTFTIVAVVMGGLTIFAMHLANKNWQALQARAYSRSAAPSPAAGAPAPARGDAIGIVMGTEERPDRPQVRTELDTDAMRRALFMAKRAEALASAGNYAEAVERYRDALNIWPYLTQVWGQMGKLYLTLKDYPKAQIALERAAEADPGNPEVLNDLGVSYLYQNRIEPARDIFETVADLNPRFAPAYFNMALCHLAQERTDEAEEMLDQFLRLMPNEPQALKERAYLYAVKGDYAAALERLKTALTAAPAWPPLYFDAAAAAALMGRIDEAIRYLDKAEALTNPSIVYRMYQQAAFREIRMTEPGRLFEKNLAERTRELMAASTSEEATIGQTEPMLSSPDTR